METYRKIFSQVLKKIKPTGKEDIENYKVFNEIIEKLKTQTPKDVKIKLVGSFAKGTHIKNKREFDIFLLFTSKYSKKDLSELTFKWAHKLFKHVTIAYAEHPYAKIKYKKFDIDLVPAYDINDIKQKATSIDRTPMHTKYINKKLTIKQKQDVRILKQFLKGLDLYGAELRIEGFSGYLSELLIVNYKDIITLFKNAATWEMPLVIDIENYQSYKQFNNPNDPMILIDPVDKNRNVSAVVSKTSMARFIFYARKFLSKPSLQYFFPSKPKINKIKLEKLIKDRQTKIKIYEFNAPEVIEDILWPQLKKTAYSIKNKIENLEYRILDFYYWANKDKCIIMYELYNDKLPKVSAHLGPNITRIKDVDKFIEKHNKAVDMQIVHDRIVTIKKRKNTKFDDDFKDIIKDDCVSIPKQFRKLLQKNKQITIKKLVKEYPTIAHTYFTRTIKN